MDLSFRHFAAKGAGTVFAMAFVASISAHAGIGTIGSAAAQRSVSAVATNAPVEKGQSAHVIDVKLDVPGCTHNFP